MEAYKRSTCEGAWYHTATTWQPLTSSIWKYMIICTDLNSVVKNITVAIEARCPDDIHHSWGHRCNSQSLWWAGHHYIKQNRNECIGSSRKQQQQQKQQRFWKKQYFCMDLWWNVLTGIFWRLYHERYWSQCLQQYLVGQYFISRRNYHEKRNCYCNNPVLMSRIKCQILLLTLTFFICDDNYRCTNISNPFSSRSKHCDAVVSVFMEPCQCRLHCGSNHYLGLWTTIRKSCVGNCVTQYNSILIKYGNISPLNQNTGRTRAISSDIRWRSVWFWEARLDRWIKKNV